MDSKTFYCAFAVYLSDIKWLYITILLARLSYAGDTNSCIGIQIYYHFQTH